MGTTIRAELSHKNKYWIEKHRYYELKHFCLQYKSWKKSYAELSDSSITSYSIGTLSCDRGTHQDLTSKRAFERASYSEKIKMIETSAKEADDFLYDYIMKGVTEDISYTYLKTKMDIPCSRDTYYDRYRKFFWILSEMRD